MTVKFIKVPVVLSVPKDDPRAVTGTITDDTIVTEFYDESDESLKRQEDECLIVDYGIYNVAHISMFYPSKATSCTMVDISGRVGIVVSPFEEFEKLAKGDK